MFCAICRTAPSTALPLYHKLRDKNLRAREDQFFTTQTRNNVPEQCTLNLLEVQRATLHTLQLHIANLVGIIHKPGRGGGGCEEWKDLAEYLHTYCTALRDLEYLGTLARSPSSAESAYITSSWQIQRDVLEHAGLIQNHMNPGGPALPPPLDARTPQLGWRAPPFTPQPSWAPPPAPIQPAAPTRATRATSTKPTSRLQRFSVAIGGALALLIPTFIMVLVPGKATDLITASVAIMVIAVFMGLSTFELRTVLSITSGYAAVMIVFVGTTKIPYNEITK